MVGNSKGVDGVWFTAAMAEMTAARVLAASGATTAMATSAMATADSNGSLLLALGTATLGTARARARAGAVRGSERGQLVAARLTTWKALVCQRQKRRQHGGIWFWFISGSEDGNVGGFGFLRGVSDVGEGSSNRNVRRRRHSVSGGAGGGSEGSRRRRRRRSMGFLRMKKSAIVDGKSYVVSL